MRKFLIRRAIFSVFTLWGITVIVFALSRLGPDPLLMFIRGSSYGLSEETAAAIRQKWALDRSIVVQYGVWLGKVVRGDMGESIATGRKVTKIIGETYGNTMQLGGAAWILATVVGIPLGVLSAVKRGSFLDYAGRILALLGQATPPFWLALVTILIFAVCLSPPNCQTGRSGIRQAISSYRWQSSGLGHLPSISASHAQPCWKCSILST